MLDSVLQGTNYRNTAISSPKLFYRYQMNLIANCICLDVVIVGLESTPAAFKDPDAAKTCLAPGAGGLKFA